jgi:hypothetical protein
MATEIHDADPLTGEDEYVSVYWTTTATPSALVDVMDGFEGDALVYIPDLAGPDEPDEPVAIDDVRTVVSSERDRFDAAVTFLRADSEPMSLVWQYAPCGGPEPTPIVAVIARRLENQFIEDLLGRLGDGDTLVTGPNQPLRVLARKLQLPEAGPMGLEGFPQLKLTETTFHPLETTFVERDTMGMES